ncbi:MAG: MBL fold metallo-hydrolase [Alcaligenaceae bacterium]|nr:MBL fold metallo-hydrolase [Alcaligenaceae bacterium]
MTNVNLNQAEQSINPIVTAFFDAQTNTYSYIVQDPLSNACAVIDPVLDFDSPSGTASYEGADIIINTIRQKKLQLEWIIETHAHADHLSSAPYIKQALGGKIAIGEKINLVQNTFGQLFNESPAFARDGSQFDHLFKNNETYQIGKLTAKAIETPGHTPACMTHIIGNAVFVGDTIFMPDGGTARADFPGGDAATLYQSIHKVLSLPEDYRIFVCHDYGPNNRDFAYETTVAQQKKHNIHVKDGVSQEEFVAKREARDKTLGMPRLILPSLQVNIRAGNMPEPEDNGTVYLKLPVNAFK